MAVQITEESVDALADYAGVPIAFDVHTVLEVVGTDGGPRGLVLRERPLDAPYVKDYDAADGGPVSWPDRFDLAQWGLFIARDGARPVGGAAVALETSGVEMLVGREDLGVLWDLRVAPDARSRGVGAALFETAATWAAARGCRRLEVETQNVNVPACRFYERMGCALGAIHRFAYPDLPGETQLLWYKGLSPS